MADQPPACCKGCKPSPGLPSNEDSSEATNVPSKEERIVKMKELLSTGKRFLLTGNYKNAADDFEAASVIAGEVFGEYSAESFDPLFNYGQSLLELAKQEDTVLSQDGISSEVPKGKDGEGSSSSGNHSGEKNEVSAGNDEEKKEEEGDEDDNDNAGEDNEDEEEEEEEDVSNHAVSWQILEASRLICENELEKFEGHDTENIKLWSLRKADVLNVLGEHAMTSSNFEQSQNDLKEALHIQKSFLEESSRIIAQTTHNIAKSYLQNDDFEQAEAQFKAAKSILEKKLEQLEKEFESRASESSESKSEIKAEVDELLELIPVLQTHIDDAAASAEQAKKIKEYLKGEMKSFAGVLDMLKGGSKGEAEEKEATDISNLIRRPNKRPVTGEAAGDETGKKVKADEQSTSTSTNEPIQSSEA